MREIEVKAKLRDKAAFLTAADKLGITFGAAIAQDDTTIEDAAEMIKILNRLGYNQGVNLRKQILGQIS